MSVPVTNENTETPRPSFVCAKCGGPRIAYFRLDADWGLGGDLYRTNHDSFYEADDPTARDEIDLSGTWCFECNGFVDVAFPPENRVKS